MSDELDLLVARSRRLGADPSLVVHGGGNTSTKLEEPDHLGRPRAVMRIKGSGTDLRTIDRSGFPGIVLGEARPLADVATMTDEEMVGHLAHAATEPGGRAPSIETLLHAFLPARHVDHTHADAICALTNHPGGRDAVREALGPDVAYVPYVRPGFELSRQVAEHAAARGVVLEHHGLVAWGDEHEEVLARTHELVRDADAFLAAATPAGAADPVPDLPPEERTALLEELRAALEPGGRVVLHVDPRQRALADRPDVERIASARGTPDHMLRIGSRTLVVRAASDVRPAVDAFARASQDYVARHADALPDGLAPLSPLPRVALVPGLGGVAMAPDPRRGQVNADLALHSQLVSARTLDAFGSLLWLDDDETFAFEYWPLELRKLAGAPSPPPLSGTVVALDAGSAPWGEGLARRLRADGALVLEPGEGDALAMARDEFGGLDAAVLAPGVTGPRDVLTVVVGRGAADGDVVLDVDPKADGALAIVGALLAELLAPGARGRGVALRLDAKEEVRG